ncbi:hypothetical protein INT48_009057 [Thamnidium elegans]|uniref:Biogenesis of lysosome-related organelles complex 1 subunit 5 n=1 Tax=Thamnidium elegans TaxID=101142 RepID=A0A8H7W3L9_9FUNG|nr:hypothetical protein INT48_009057 [Thamnidium elegans]
MTKFTAQSLYSDLSQLDDLIFKQGQHQLEQELNDFVQSFETKDELVLVDSIAKSYVQLTSCEQKLKSSENTELVTATQQKSKLVLDDLTQVLESINEVQAEKNNLPFQSEREAYLIEREERKKAIENELRRESDKIDERYAKLTRDSIYRNLVGYNP